LSFLPAFCKKSGFVRFLASLLCNNQPKVIKSEFLTIFEAKTPVSFIDYFSGRVTCIDP
jgi:hypothetical protein